MSKKNEIRRRSILAARRYLKMRGWDVLSTSLDVAEPKPFHIVGTDDAGSLVFVRVHAYNRPPEPGDAADVDGEMRCQMESAFCHFLLDHPEHKDVPVRADAIDVYVISHDRALLRHQVNCVNCSGL